MSTKSLLCTLCVAAAFTPWTARGQETATTRKASTPSVAAKPAVNSTSPGVAGTAAKPASARHMAARSAAMPHPTYHAEPEFHYGPQMGCADGSCYEDYGGYDSWWCYPQLSHWGSVEYLLWWRKGQPIPALVSNGALNAANAEILFGAAEYDFGPQSGGRITFGVWFDDQECIGVGGRLFSLGDGHINFQQTDGPNGVLSRPFIDADTRNANAVNIAGALGGSIDIDIESEVYGGDALFRKRIECGFDGRLDVVFGYQFSRINESLDIRTSTTLPPGAPNALNVFDHFSTENEFHGGALGLQAEIDRGCLTVGFLTKVGLGNMREAVSIRGDGNPANTGLQGLLAQNSNIGEYEESNFAVVPEVNLNLGYAVTEHLDVSIGYSMLYWSHVVRPGEQVDLTVDLTPAAAPAVNRPRFEFDSNDFWVMGLNFGCQWSY